VVYGSKRRFGKRRNIKSMHAQPRGFDVNSSGKELRVATNLAKRRPHSAAGKDGRR
jgi:hypothetical protein